MLMDYNGRKVEVVEVEVLHSSEPWSEYELLGGVVLSHKTVLVSVYRALTEKAPDGSVLYLTKSQNIVKVKGV